LTLAIEEVIAVEEIRKTEVATKVVVTAVRVRAATGSDWPIEATTIPAKRAFPVIEATRVVPRHTNVDAIETATAVITRVISAAAISTTTASTAREAETVAATAVAAVIMV
jgi:hypothetical protein